MKKSLFIILSVVFVLMFAVSAQAAEQFVLGFDPGFEPYGFIDENGDYVGYDIDLAAEVCERNGWELVLQPIDWDAKDNELDSGTITCIWNGFTKSEARLNLYEWTDAYKDAGQVIAVRADSDIQSLDDLAGKVVITQADSSAYDLLNSEDFADLTATFASLLTEPMYTTAFMDLEAGGADAVAGDYDVVVSAMESNEGAFRILDEELAPEQYAVAFKLGNTELRDTVQKTLEEMTADGTCAEISAKWFDGMDTCIIGK